MAEWKVELILRSILEHLTSIYRLHQLWSLCCNIALRSCISTTWDLLGTMGVCRSPHSVVEYHKVDVGLRTIRHNRGGHQWQQTVHIRRTPNIPQSCKMSSWCRISVIWRYITCYSNMSSRQVGHSDWSILEHGTSTYRHHRMSSECHTNDCRSCISITWDWYDAMGVDISPHSVVELCEVGSVIP